MIFLSFLIFCVLFTTSVTLAGVSLKMFVDFPSIILVVGGIFIFILATRQVSTFWKGLKLIFSFRETSGIHKEKAMQISRFFKTLSYFSLVYGGLWTLMGLVLMFGNLDPELIGTGIAVSLLTLFYSLVVSVTIFMPISIQYRNMVTEHRRHHKRVFSFREKFPASYT